MSVSQVQQVKAIDLSQLLGPVLLALQTAMPAFGPFWLLFLQAFHSELTKRQATMKENHCDHEVCVELDESIHALAYGLCKVACARACLCETPTP